MRTREVHPLRVLHVFDDQLFGIAASVRELAGGLMDNGVGVSVALLDVQSSPRRASTLEELLPNGIPVRHVRLSPPGLPWVLKPIVRAAQLPRALRGLRARAFDLIHCHLGRGNIRPWFFAYPAALRAGVPLVGTQHGDLAAGGSPDLSRLLRLAMSRLDGLAVLTQATGDLLKRHGACSKVCLLRNCIGVNRWREGLAQTSSFRSLLEIPDTAFVVGLVGRFVPCKGYDVALEGIANCSSRDDEETYVIVAGEGPLEERLRVQASRLGLGERIRFLGYCRDLFSLYASLDVLLVSSSRETQPLVILEALASAVPVVATPVGGIPTMLFEGAGMLIPTRSAESISLAIDKLREDPKARERLAQTGLRRVRDTYDSGVVARLYIDQLYAPVLSRQGCGRRGSGG